MIAIQDEKFLSPAEVGRMFCKAESTVVSWIRSGLLEAKKAGGTVLIREADLLKMLEGTE